MSAIFHCLAKATFAMAHGIEDLSAQGWDKDIVHMDLKSANGKRTR